MASCLALLSTDHTHIIATGFNDIAGMLEAVSRYGMGGAGYVDPVAFENVFKMVDGAPRPTFEPVIRVRVSYCSANAALIRSEILYVRVFAETRS